MMMKTIDDEFSWASLFLNSSYGSAFGFRNMLSTHTGLLYLYRLHAASNHDNNNNHDDNDNTLRK